MHALSVVERARFHTLRATRYDTKNEAPIGRGFERVNDVVVVVDDAHCRRARQVVGGCFALLLRGAVTEFHMSIQLYHRLEIRFVFLL